MWKNASSARRTNLGGQVDRVELEHHIGDHRADASSGSLGHRVQHRITGGDGSEQAIDERDGRVEMRARDCAEHEGQPDEGAGCRCCVLEQLQTEVVG